MRSSKALDPCVSEAAFFLFSKSSFASLHLPRVFELAFLQSEPRILYRSRSITCRRILWVLSSTPLLARWIREEGNAQTMELIRDVHRGIDGILPWLQFTPKARPLPSLSGSRFSADTSFMVLTTTSQPPSDRISSSTSSLSVSISISSQPSSPIYRARPSRKTCCTIRSFLTLSQGLNLEPRS